MKQPTMPAPLAGGGWTPQPLSASEASIWMRELLKPFSPESIRDVATHSSKATILSWMSKANVEISLRRLAGYHICPGDKSALEYSRDAAAPVLRQIEAIFISVRANLFRPDMPRSQRWCGAQTLEDAVKIASTQPHRHDFSSLFESQFDHTMSDLSKFQSDAFECRTEQFESFPDFADDTTLWDLREHTLNKTKTASAILLDEASDVSDEPQSSESADASDTGSEDLERRVVLDGEKNAADLVPPSDLVNKECFKHLKSGKLHLVGKMSLGVKTFKCGRKCNDNYELLSSVPAFAAHGCMTCFGWSLKPSSDSSD